MAKELPTYVTEGVFDGIYDCGEGNCTWSFSESVENEYLTFLSALPQKVFQIYTQNNIGKSRFATYVKDSEAVRVAWYQATEECRVVYQIDAPKNRLLAPIPTFF